MSKEPEKISSAQSENDTGIFGKSKSREEIKNEMKEQKRQLREQEKAAVRARREKRKMEPKERNIVVIVMSCILAAVVLICGVMLALQLRPDPYERDEEKTGYFLNDDAKPELTTDGLSAAVNEVYYTTGGYLCVRMTLGNGLDQAQFMTKLEVQIYNSTDELIASGFTNDIRADYSVPTQGYNAFTFYISPEYVKLTDDPLSTITYSVMAEGYVADGNAETTTTAAQ